MIFVEIILAIWELTYKFMLVAAIIAWPIVYIKYRKKLNKYYEMEKATKLYDKYQFIKSASRLNLIFLVGFAVMLVLNIINVAIHYSLYNGYGGASFYGVMLFFAFPLYLISGWVYKWSAILQSEKGRLIKFIWTVF